MKESGRLSVTKFIKTILSGFHRQLIISRHASEHRCRILNHKK